MANSTVSPQEKFEAAVRVIQSLPKNGSFQPSHEMMLRFYALYKQANFGPCTDSKPAFWDVVRKAKWDAWQKLKDMSSESAMLLYVEELKKVIETMPHTPDVSAFLEKLGSFYELVDEEEDISNGAPTDTEDDQQVKIRDSIKLAAKKMIRSRGNSDSISNGDDSIRNNRSLEESKIKDAGSAVAASEPKIELLNGNSCHALNGNSKATSREMDQQILKTSRKTDAASGQPEDGSSDDDDDEDESDDEGESDDEFCDVASSYSLTSIPHGSLVSAENSTSVNRLAMDSGSTSLSTQIMNSLARLERDIQTLSSRVNSMDRYIRSLSDSRSSSYFNPEGKGGPGDGDRPPRRPWWWRFTFDRLALRNVVFIVFWPILVQIIGRFIIRKLRTRSLKRVLPR